MEQNVMENTNVEQIMPMAKKKPWKGIVFGILAMIAYYGAQVAAMFLVCIVLAVQSILAAGGDVNAGMILFNETLVNADTLTVITAISTLASALVALLWYKLRYVKKYTAENRAHLKQNVLKKKIIISLIIAAIGAYSLDILVANVVAVLSPSAADNFNSLMNSAFGGNAIVSFITVVILAPIGEEALFRGIIFNMFSKHWSEKVAIVATAVFFGLFHMNLMQAIYALPIGLLLGYTAYKFKTVIPCILIHMVNNFMPTVVGLLPEALQSVVTFIVLLLVSVAALYVIWKKKDEAKGYC